MTDVMQRALLVGNSDGIGRALTRSLRTAGWQVSGISRSPLDLDADYVHAAVDVTAPNYPLTIARLWEERGPFDLVVHCVGIGSGMDETGLTQETRTVATNFLSLVQIVETLLPRMLERGAGHLIGLSSVADDIHIAESPSYSGSKAGYSNYLKSLALYLAPKGVAVTNVRFGFVDTKMAKADVKPMMISVERAAALLMGCVRRRPMQLTYPKTVGVIIRILRWCQSLRLWTARVRVKA